jgi:hypothetical protein
MDGQRTGYLFLMILTAKEHDGHLWNGGMMELSREAQALTEDDMLFGGHLEHRWAYKIRPRE